MAFSIEMVKSEDTICESGRKQRFALISHKSLVDLLKRPWGSPTENTTMREHYNEATH